MASAVIALGALVVSIWSAIRSTKAGKDAQTARETASTAQWKMSEHLQAIAEAQAKVAEAAVSPTMPGGSASSPTKQGGRLSARLTKMGNSARITVANVGVEEVEVLSVDVAPDVSAHGGPSIEGVSLDPGEDFSLMAEITLDTSLPLTVRMRWRDSGGEQEREQKVTFS